MQIGTGGQSGFRMVKIQGQEKVKNYTECDFIDPHNPI